jgi:hypothetical protein
MWEAAANFFKLEPVGRRLSPFWRERRFASVPLNGNSPAGKGHFGDRMRSAGEISPNPLKNGKYRHKVAVELDLSYMYCLFGPISYTKKYISLYFFSAWSKRCRSKIVKH